MARQKKKMPGFKMGLFYEKTYTHPHMKLSKRKKQLDPSAFHDENVSRRLKRLLPSY